MLGIAVSAASGRSDAGAAAWGRIAFSYRFWPEDTRIVDNYEIFAMDVGTGSDENITRNPGATDRPRVVAKRPLDRVRVSCR